MDWYNYNLMLNDLTLSICIIMVLSKIKLKIYFTYYIPIKYRNLHLLHQCHIINSKVDKLKDFILKFTQNHVGL